MIPTKPARIFKADSRKTIQSSEYRCLTTLLGKGTDYQEPLFDTLLSFNDETLAAGKRTYYEIEEDVTVLLLPLVGLLEVEEPGASNKRLVIPEEIMVLSLSKGQAFYLRNPNKKGLVNFLQIRIRAHVPTLKKSFANYSENVLFSILGTAHFQLHFGVFNGRRETEYRLEDPKNGIFGFCINGAFELENRLLESRDGLALWNTDNLEMEALSDNAIIVLLEIYTNSKTLNS